MAILTYDFSIMRFSGSQQPAVTAATAADRLHIADFGTHTCYLSFLCRRMISHVRWTWSFCATARISTVVKPRCELASAGRRLHGELLLRRAAIIHPSGWTLGTDWLLLYEHLVLTEISHQSSNERHKSSPWQMRDQKCRQRAHRSLSISSTMWKTFCFIIQAWSNQLSIKQELRGTLVIVRPIPLAKFILLH